MWYQFDLCGDIGARHHECTIFPFPSPAPRCCTTCFLRSWLHPPSRPLHSPFYGPPEVRLSLLQNHRLWRAVLVAMLIPLALVAYWPSPVDEPVSGQLTAVLNFLHGHGIPGWLNYQFVEAAANVVLFVPVGFVGSLAFPEKRWWQIGAFGLLVSGCIELGQLLFLHDRFASLSDIVTNTSGAVIGALLAALAVQTWKRPAVFRQRASKRR